MACISEGEVPASTLQYQLTSSADDAGITARLAKKLVIWTSPDAGKLEVIRPGTFTAQYIRSTGLKTPVLIKGDRFNESPQLGLMWPDVHNISVDVLSDYIGGDRKVDTWDVVKQRPGPAWTLSQWCTYWHARLEAATRQAKPATAHGAPGMLINDDDDEEGEVVDSGVVIVLQGVQGAAHSRYKPAPACVGISPEQAQRLLDGECLPLHGSQLCQHIHPPPAIQSVDLVRQAEKDLEVLFPPRRDSTAAGNGPAKSDLARGAMIGPERERETSRDGGSSMYGPRRDDSGRTRVFPALAINPADTLHLQMTPKDCFSDFRMAPGGAATWLYVLQGLKVVVLLPPTLRNRRLFLTWATATRANQPKENVLVECLLADYAEGAVKVQLKASQALVIPAGWFYASAATTDTLAVGCYFWHPYCLADSARAQQMELQLKLKPQRFTLPARNLLWYAGIAYGCKLRKEFGLQDLLLRRDISGAARRSVSEASLNQQQQRASPYLRGMAGQVAAAGSEQQQQRRRLIRNAGDSVTPGNTPPLIGVHAAGAGIGVGTPTATTGKRGRQSDVMEHLYLGDSAVPVAAAGVGLQQQQPKRIKIATGKPITPPLAGVAGAIVAAAGVAVSTHSTPYANSQQQNMATGLHPAVAGFVPSSSNHSRRQQRMLTPGPGSQRRYAAAVNDDDDDGECHTSPVRRIDPEPVDYVAAAAAGADGYAAWDALPGHASAAAAPQQQQCHDATFEPSKPITALKIRVPGKALPLYSPVIQPMKGDLDSIPQLPAEQSQQRAGTPRAAAPAKTAANAANGLLLPPAAAAAATPGRKKLTLKGQATPTAAAAAAAGGVDVVWPQGSPAPGAVVWQQQQQMRRRSSPEQDSSAGSHAVASEATYGTNASSRLQQQQLPYDQAAARGQQQQQQQRRMVLEHVSDDEDDLQQQQLLPVLASMPQQHIISQSNPPRPPSTTAAAAGPAAGAKGGAPLKLKLKLLSPSPRFVTLQAPQSGPEVPPALSLDDQPAAAAQQQQQQQGQVAGVGVVPQVDGAGTTYGNCQQQQLSEVGAVVPQSQHVVPQLRQQQQPGRQADLWSRWHKLQSSMHARHRQQQQQQGNAVSTGMIMATIIPQVDGANEDGRPTLGGPTLVLQPAPHAAVPVRSASATATIANGLQPITHRLGHGGQATAAAAAAGGPAAVGKGFLSPGKAQQQQQQQQAVVRLVPQTAAVPPAVKQQQLLPALPAVLRNHAVNTASTAQQQQQATALPATAGHNLPGHQQGLVIPRIPRNPVLQPQVQKLKQAVAGRTPSPPIESLSPRDTGVCDPRGVDARASIGGSTAVALDPPIQQQQQQDQGGAVAGRLTEGQPRAAGAGGLTSSLQGPMIHRNSQGSRQGQLTQVAGDVAADVATHAVCVPGDTSSSPVAGASRVGSSNLLTLVSPPATAGHILPARRSSVGIVGDSSQAAAAAGEHGALPRVSPPPFYAGIGSKDRVVSMQQQPGSMGPPPPTKLSVWELLELPVLIDLLQEQVSDRICEIQQVVPVVDAELVVQQLQEVVGESRRQRNEQQQQQHQAALQIKHPQQQQQQAVLQQQASKPQQQQLGGALINGGMVQQQPNPSQLVVLPLTQNEMPPGLWEHIRLGQQLLRANGALLGHGLGDLAHDATTEVVGEHDPHEGSAGATSLDNCSAGTIGGSRGVAATAGGAVVGRVLHYHQPPKRGALPRGEQQAKDMKKQKIKKGLGIMR